MPDAASPILVTGASGFVGGHLVERLVSGGSTVRALLRSASSQQWLKEGANLRIHRAGFDDTSGLEEALSGVRAVYHLAAVTSASKHNDYFRANLHATRSLVDAVRKVAPDAVFVLCSTQAAAGPSRGGRPLTEMDPPQPISPYGKSKLEAEQIVIESGLHAVVVRPPTVYGPRDRDILEMFRWASWGLAPVVGFHDQKLSIVHVHDLISGLIAASGAPRGSTYFITDGRTHTRSGLIQMIAKAVERNTMGIRIPTMLALSYAYVSRAFASISGTKPLLTPERIRDFSEPDWTCDDTRARRELGYESVINIEDGMLQTARWYKEQKWI